MGETTAPVTMVVELRRHADGSVSVLSSVGELLGGVTPLAALDASGIPARFAAWVVGDDGVDVLGSRTGPLMTAIGRVLDGVGFHDAG